MTNRKKETTEELVDRVMATARTLKLQADKELAEKEAENANRKPTRN